MTEVKDFIEHFGKKGMRWGHRKTTSSTSGNKKHHLTSKQKKIIGGTTAIAATAVISSVLARRGMISVKQANKQANAKAAKALLDVHKKIKLSAIDPKIAQEVKAYGQYKFRGGS